MTAFIAFILGGILVAGFIELLLDAAPSLVILAVVVILFGVAAIVLNAIYRNS